MLKIVSFVLVGVLVKIVINEFGEVGVFRFILNIWKISVLFIFLVIIVKNKCGFIKINGK